VKTTKMTTAALLLGAMCAAVPAGAADWAKCESMGVTLAVTEGSLIAIKAAIKSAKSEMEMAYKLTAIPVVADKDTEFLKHSIPEEEAILEDIAALFEPVPAVSGPFNEAGTGLKTFRDDAVYPASQVLHPIVVELQLEKVRREMQETINALKFMDDQISLAAPAVMLVKIAATQAINDVNALPEGPCKEAAIQKGGQSCGTVLANALDLNKIVVPLAGVMKQIEDALKEMEGLMSGMQPVQKGFEDIDNSMKELRKASNGIKSVLKHRIAIKWGKVTVEKISVGEILKDWNGLVKRIEKTFHITDLKKMLQKEIATLTKPEVDKIKSTIRGLEKGIKVDGFSLDDGRRIFADFEAKMAGLVNVNTYESEFTQAKADLESLANSCGK